MDDHIEEPLKEFNNTSSDKVHLWSWLSYKTQKKAGIFLFVILTISVINTYFFQGGCSKQKSIKTENKIN
jgi:hypothetical protein